MKTLNHPILIVNGRVSEITIYLDHISIKPTGLSGILSEGKKLDIRIKDVQSTDLTIEGQYLILEIDYLGAPRVESKNLSLSNIYCLETPENKGQLLKAKILIEAIKNETFSQEWFDSISFSAEQLSDIKSNPNIKKPAHPPQVNLVKLVLFIFCYFMCSELTQIALKNIFSAVYSEEVFRGQLMKMCGSVWHGSMNYIDWFFRPTFECDQYKFNLVATHGFILLNMTLSYITIKTISNLIFHSEKKGYFRWVNRRVFFIWLIIDVISVFLIAYNRAFIIGYSPDDNVWALDILLITLVHICTFYFWFNSYKWIKPEEHH
jgi:hypothetical protein